MPTYPKAYHRYALLFQFLNLIPRCLYCIRPAIPCTCWLSISQIEEQLLLILGLFNELHPRYTDGNMVIILTS